MRESLRQFARSTIGTIGPLVDLYRFAASPRWEFDVWADFVAFARSWRFLREVPSPPANAPRALLVTFRDDIYDAKVFAMLAVGLKLAGIQPVLLAPSHRMTRTLRMFEWLRLGTPLLRADVADVAVDAAAITQAHDAITGGGAIDLAGVMGWWQGDVNIGPLALSSLIRRTQDGAPDLADAEQRAMLRRIAREVLISASVARTVLERVQPTVVLLQEPGYAENGAFVDVALAMGRTAIHVQDAWRDDALLLKRLVRGERRALPQSVARSTFCSVVKRPWTRQREHELRAAFVERYGGTWAMQAMFQPQTAEHSRDDIVRELSLDPGRKIAVVFSHVLWDATFWAGEDLYDNYSDWLVNVVRAACRNDRVSWVIKTHPANLFRHQHGDVRERCAELVLLREQVGALPDHVRVLPPDTPFKSLSLYREADIGLTVRGLAGMEMACFGKPVLTAGTGSYVGFGFTTDSSSRAEYEGRLAAIESLSAPTGEERERACWYAHTLFRRRPFLLKSFKPSFRFQESGWNPLDRNLHVVADSIEDIRAKGDLSAFAGWALGGDIDYLGGE